MAWEAWFAVGLIINAMLREMKIEDDNNDMRRAMAVVLAAVGITCVVLF